jgi:hypothetical protein
MDTLFNLADVADRLGMSLSAVWVVPFLTIAVLWIASRLTASRSNGLIFYSGGHWRAQAARFSFAATLTLTIVILLVRAEPELLVRANYFMDDVSGLIRRALAV